MKRSIGKGAEQFDLVVMGGSAGVHQVLPVVLGGLPSDFRLPVVIVRHVCPEFCDCGFSVYLNERCRLTVKEADQEELITGGHVYLAPANYHLLVEKDRTLSLNIDEKVKYCRPAIDVLFETAAYALGSKLIGVILSGANDDGADG
ncbi:MAG: chemotaxis protein CheB, partial [Deltaproteobacteria bacterium]|nr:chemotaxis protein CheB [Deltaproteobacteria bacterium]